MENMSVVASQGCDLAVGRKVVQADAAVDWLITATLQLLRYLLLVCAFLTAKEKLREWLRALLLYDHICYLLPALVLEQCLSFFIINDLVGHQKLDHLVQQHLEYLVD